jgi:hypothetical protein
VKERLIYCITLIKQVARSVFFALGGCLLLVTWPNALSQGADELPNEDRIAFIIGNANYEGAPQLKNPINDARSIEAQLKSLGFETYFFNDLKFAQVQELRKKLESRLKRNSVLFFYYAGHGVQLDGRNYLVTVDADAGNEEDLTNQSLYLGDVLHAIERKRPKIATVILDACRDNPNKHNKVPKSGLARVDPPTATVVFYATRPGGVAADGDDQNSPFTKALVQEMKRVNQPLEVLFRRVSTQVYKGSKGEQEPWIEGVIRDEFVISDFQPPMVVASIRPASAQSIAPVAPMPITSSASLAEATALLPEVIQEVSQAATLSAAESSASKGLSYSQALQETAKLLGTKPNGETSTAFACDEGTCLPYKTWAKSLKNQDAFEQLKKNLTKFTNSKEAKLCEFNINEDRCFQEDLSFTVISPLMLFMPRSAMKNFDISEIKTTNSGGLTFNAVLKPYRGQTPIPCYKTEGRIEFSNDKAELVVARFGCFGIAPSTVKSEFEVLLVNFEKREFIVKWNANMVSFGAAGFGSGIARISL